MCAFLDASGPDPLDGPVRYADAPARRAELLKRLRADGYVSSARSAADLGVSEMTIRRDLRRLEEERLVQRVAGGASLPRFGHGAPFEERAVTRGAEKRAIAAACLPLLDGCTTVVLDAGTTIAPLAAEVAPGTTVVSHSLPVLTACAERDDLDVIAIGGEYQRDTRSFTGASAREALGAVAADVAVLSATALDATGLLCANPRDAELKRAIAAVAVRTVLLVDSGKIGARAPFRVGALDAVDVLVTGPAADPAVLALARAAGVEVLLAEEGAGADALP
jgi:DeoR/GlpR family transcriptional regulator of sugar metabolism